MSGDALSEVLNASVVAEGELFDSGIRRTLSRLTKVERWMIVVGLGLAAAVELGTTIAINVILTDMKGNVAASQDEISWVVTVYGAAFLCVVPLSTWFARRLGTRNYLVLSLLLYGGGALGCFLSETLPALLVSRIVMGIGGGAFLVRAMTAITRLHAPNERGPALLVFALIVNSSRAIMPVLFGVVTDNTRWNIAFLAIVPLTLMAAGLLYKVIPRRLEFEPDPPPIDLISTGLIVAGLTAFQVAMSRGEQDMWLESPLICSMLVVAVVSLAVFVWRDTRQENANPVLNLRLLWREPSLASGTLLAVIFGVLLSASLFVLPQYLRGVQDYNATQTALFFCADAIAMYVGLAFGATFAPKLSPQVVVLLGLSVFVIANHLLTLQLTPDTPALNLYLIVVLHGASLGMQVPAVSSILLGKSSPRYLAFDMAIYYHLRGVGSVLGVSAAAAMLDIRESVHSSRLLDVAGRLNPDVQRLVTGLGHALHARGLPATTANLGSYQIFQGLVARQTLTLAYIDIFWCFEILALAGIVLVLVLWPNARRAASAVVRRVFVLAFKGVGRSPAVASSQ
jgi:MFS transporter, DHA2 family, multidrug resistance protein